MGSIYEPLTEYLKALTVKSVTFAFGEIEAILGRPLPRGAYDTDTWWITQTAWQAVGWYVLVLDRGNESVRFARR